MATITITLSEEHKTRLFDAFADGYEDTISDGEGGTIPNPQSRADFAREEFMREMRQYVKNIEEAKAIKLATESVVLEEDIDVTI